MVDPSVTATDQEAAEVSSAASRRERPGTLGKLRVMFLPSSPAPLAASVEQTTSSFSDALTICFFQQILAMGLPRTGLGQGDPQEVTVQ